MPDLHGATPSEDLAAERVRFHAETEQIRDDLFRNLTAVLSHHLPPGEVPEVAAAKVANIAQVYGARIVQVAEAIWRERTAAITQRARSAALTEVADDWERSFDRTCEGEHCQRIYLDLRARAADAETEGDR